MVSKTTPLDKARSARRESKYVEFKEQFDPTQQAEWCEFIKDIIALSNSGGGWVLFGVRNDGNLSDWDPGPILALDPAVITDRLARYTGEQFSDFEIVETEREGHPIPALRVLGAASPIAFIQPGTYDVGGGRQKSAFGKGTVYFRHGAKSEPGNSQDLRDCIDRVVEGLRRGWMGNIRKVVEAPLGHKVSVLPPGVVESPLPTATPIRIVDDPRAPAYRKIDPDQTHPHRQKDIIQILNQRIGPTRSVSSYDIQCVRRVHDIDRKPQYFYKSKFASPQYSPDFADWLVAEYERDSKFFDKARLAARQQA